MIGGRRLTWAAVAAAAVAAGVPALPFAQSGSRTRSGYVLVRTAQSAGILEGVAGATAVVALAFLPLLAAAAFAAASLHRPVAVATLAVMAGGVVGGAGIAILTAPVVPLVGAGAAVVAGAVAVGLGAAAAVAMRRR